MGVRCGHADVDIIVPVAAMTGTDPVAFGLTIRCSTIELQRQISGQLLVP